jgi:toxin ParE1/3/4
MPPFNIRIEDRATQDIQNGFDYYEELQEGLGIRFNQEVFHAVEILRSNPFFQIRYNSFRCFPIRRFPFMIHYEVDENLKTITIYAVINTYLDPKEKWIKV